MVALIFGWPEGDSYLVEQVLGIYDSEESVPEKYKQFKLEDFKTRAEAEEFNKPIYCGANLTLSNPIIFWEDSAMECVPYYRVQLVKLNQPIDLLVSYDR